jgi:diguanylate cyclase (GGDEF)-like protein|tara:strand:+ start:4435 stop:5337 length:903 start_codon:yes stop_codon:yes gene_type:complete
MAKILIVDDIAHSRQILRFDLIDDEHEVIEADNGHACISMSESERPDLILLDIMMPGIGGLTTIQRLKSNPATKMIPVIMVSANNAKELIIAAFDNGAHDYVSKPVIYPVLAARIRSALRLKQAQDELSVANSALQQLASTDTLTGLFNRRHFINLVTAELSKSKRYQRQLSMIMIDADYFKQLNDNFGHAAGDQALIQLAKTCLGLCREADIIGRIGGEEFLICCPETDLCGACDFAERIRSFIEVCHKNALVTNTPQFTVSIGVSQYHIDDSLETLMAKVDKQLYRAKDCGRNRVEHD